MGFFYAMEQGVPIRRFFAAADYMVMFYLSAV
jgi:hypothetical protein